MKSIIELFRELFGFLWREKKWWMFPVVFILLLIGGLLVATHGSAISPFIYTMF